MTVETKNFKAEIKQLMDIIIHSLYSNKEVFLRELISNASDAIDKARFEALTNKEIEERSWKIKIIPDKEAGTLTIADNGIGMSPENIGEYLGTVAKSGTVELLERLKKADEGEQLRLIGQFGVGFYASFIVADQVTVISRMHGQPAVRWQSDGQGTFTIEPCEKESEGTDVILKLKEEEKQFLDQWQIRNIVKKFSDFVEHPIVMDVEKVEHEGEGEQKKEVKKIVEEQINSGKAIWLRQKSEIKEEEYREFYKHLTRDFHDPLKTIHYFAEGQLEFKALLYIPAEQPFDFMWAEPTPRLHLYVNRVFIMDSCEALLPTYLRFVKGVVDSSDLPLNVSREMLQNNRVVSQIQKNLVNKILSTLAEMQSKEYDDYLKFYAAFGMVLKEGISQDWANREKLADLLLLESTRTEPGKFTTLAKYVAGMPEDQQAIYYITGEHRKLLENSPYLEVFKAKGQEVLLLTDPIDEFMVSALTEYKGKKLKAVNKGELKDEQGDETTQEKRSQEFKDLLSTLQEKISEVKEVRLSNRMKASAACLVADEGDMGPHMEHIMRRLGKTDLPPNKRILELNADHPLVQRLQALHAAKSDDPRIGEYGRLLYEQAVLAEGSKLEDPAAFNQRLNSLMLQCLEQDTTSGSAPSATPQKSAEQAEVKSAEQAEAKSAEQAEVKSAEQAETKSAEQAQAQTDDNAD